VELCPSANFRANSKEKAMNIICLVLAVLCFSIGTFQKLAATISPDINWQNAGLAFVTLALVI